MRVSNVPAITRRYWAAILVASMCGANTGDFLSHNLHLGHTRGLLPLAALFLLILWAERRARIPTEAYYWLAIIVLRTAATNLADLCTHDLNLGYGATEIGLTLLLIAFLVTDRSRDPSIGSIAQQDRPRLPATNGNYWLAMLTAGTLGTTSGDFTADVVGLGLFIRFRRADGAVRSCADRLLAFRRHDETLVLGKHRRGAHGWHDIRRLTREPARV